VSELKSVLLAIDVATQRRDMASKELGKTERAHRHAQEQLEQLELYAADTDAKWTRAATGGVAPGVMFHHFQFMDRLYHAIGLQRNNIDETLAQAASAKKALLEAEFRLIRLRQLLKAKQHELHAEQARHEQKQMDEFAVTQYLRSAGQRLNGEFP
jgi:flagellar FliJ protein